MLFVKKGEIEMILASKMREFRPTYEFPNGESITLESLSTQLTQTAQKHEIPLEILQDKVLSFKLIKPVLTDCIVLIHPKYKSKYFSFVVCIKREGDKAFVSTSDIGSSKNDKKLNKREDAKNQAKATKSSISYSNIEDELPSALGSLTKSAVGTLSTLGASKNKQEQEQNYYGAIAQILNEVIY